MLKNLRVSCEPTPQPDQASYNMADTTDVSIREFETATFSCKPGATLNGETDDIFSISCDNPTPTPPTGQGTFSAVSWPTCTVEACVGAPAIAANADLSAVDGAVPVPVGQHRHYKCPAGQVLTSGATYALECLPTGDFATPTGRLSTSYVG